MLVPVALAGKPGKSYLERRIAPAARKPGGVVHYAQTSQCLDQVQLSGVKMPKLFVSLKQGGQLRRLFLLVARQEHPQVLYRRCAPGVIEIDNVYFFARYQHIAGMKIRVNPKIAHVACSRYAGFDFVEYLRRYSFIRFFQFVGDNIVVEQVFAGCYAVAFDIYTWTGLKLARLADQMNAGNESPELALQIVVVELGCPATATLVHGESKACRFEQGFSSVHKWRDDRQVAVSKLHCETVFFCYLRVAPTPRSVEFGDHWPVIFNTDLIDPIFVTIEREEPTVAAVADVLQGRNNLFRLQIGVRKG
jgi:hypothetical protein